MRMSDKLRNINIGDSALPVWQQKRKGEAAIEQAADLLDVYYIQCTAAMKAESLGLCKKSIKYALEEDT